MYEYQKNKNYFAQVAEGIKELGSRELAELGALNITPEYGGLYLMPIKKRFTASIIPQDLFQEYLHLSRRLTAALRSNCTKRPEK